MKLNPLNLNQSYILAFREEVHIILAQYNYFRAKLPTSLLCKKKNFLHNKRRINQLHYLGIDYKKSSVLEYMNHIKADLWKDMTILFTIQFMWFTFQNYSDKTNLLKSHNSTTSLTMFVENRFRSLNTNLYTKIIKCYHPEILVRIMRQHCRDTCILQLLRIFLYSDYNQFQLKSNLVIESFYLSNTQLIYFVLSELDKFTYGSLCHLYGYIKTESIHYYQINTKNKWELSELTILASKSKDKTILSSPYEKLLYSAYYLRYNNHILWALKGEVNCVQLIRRRFTRFYERRLYGCRHHDLNDQNRLAITWLQTTIQIKKFRKEGQLVQSVNRLPILLEFTVISIVIPNDLLVKNFKRYSISTENGYPLSKVNWISLNDKQICQYFHEIYITLYFNYSGVHNINIVDYLYYILKYSYVKTIAFKHKKSFRFVLKSDDKFKIFVPVYHSRKNRLKSIYSCRIWHLDILNLNFFFKRDNSIYN